MTTRPTLPRIDERRMLRFLAAAAAGLMVVLSASALPVLLGGRLTSALGIVDPADALQRAVPWLAKALDGFSFIADIGRHAGWALLPAVSVALLIRRLPGPAGFVAVSAAGSVLLGESGALLTVLWRTGEGGRTGTAAPDPVYDDTLGLTVTAIVGMLLLAPVLSARARRWVAGVLLLTVAGFGMLAVASGFGTMTAVVGGWLVGAAWAITVAIAYRRWCLGIPPTDAPLHAGLPVENLAALRPAPARDRVAGVGGAFLLVVAALLVGGAVLAAGLLVILPSAAIQRFDVGVIGWFTDLRGPVLTDAATIIDAFGNTPGILAVHLAAVPITLALTRRRAPAVFLVVALVGETAIYLVTGAIVGRDRPDVDHLTMGVPGTSGYPSGHVAASLVTYCGIALLVTVWSRSRWRHAAMPVAVLIVAGVVLARLYWGLHYPTDTLVSLPYAAAWLAVCWWVIRPDRGSDGRDAPAEGAAEDATHDGQRCGPELSAGNPAGGDASGAGRPGAERPAGLRRR